MLSQRTRCVGAGSEGDLAEEVTAHISASTPAPRARIPPRNKRHGKTQSQHLRAQASALLAGTASPLLPTSWPDPPSPANRPLHQSQPPTQALMGSLLQGLPGLPPPCPTRWLSAISTHLHHLLGLGNPPTSSAQGRAGRIQRSVSGFNSDATACQSATRASVTNICHLTRRILLRRTPRRASQGTAGTQGCDAASSTTAPEQAVQSSVG